MNPEQKPINMNYRFKYIAVGLITYVVVTYAWKLYKNKSE